MKPGLLNRKSTTTQYVQLDTGKCRACWRCLEGCHKQIIGKVDFPWHRHALIVEPDACSGCLNCFNSCHYDAYSINDGAKQKNEMHKNRTFNHFLINSLLLVSGLAMVFSGLVMQIGFHMGGPDEQQIVAQGAQSASTQYEQIRMIDTTKTVCGFNYPDWSTIHKFVIVFFSLLIIYHAFIHWKWYKGIIAKHLIRKNIQVIILSVLFLLVALTGLIPWVLDLSGNSGILRILFIEIHDKITLILIVFLVLHSTKRLKWYISAFEKLKH